MPTADGLLAIPGVLQDGSVALQGEAAERRDEAVLAALGSAIEALGPRGRRRGSVSPPCLATSCIASTDGRGGGRRRAEAPEAS